MVPEEGVEPTRSKAPADFESAASASSATPGLLAKLTRHASSLKHLGVKHAERRAARVFSGSASPRRCGSFIIWLLKAGLVLTVLRWLRENGRSFPFIRNVFACCHRVMVGRFDAFRLYIYVDL
jgi:hypothetical protein